MKKEIKKILYKFLQDGISSDDAAQQVLNLFSVSRQREMLLAYEKFRMGHTLNATEEWHKENVELFLANNSD